MEGLAYVRERLIPTVIVCFALGGASLSAPLPHDTVNQHDTTYLKQQLYNGRVWEKKYDKVSGHEFFLTKALTEASVTVDDRTFNDQLIWYDIFNDRIVLMVRPGLFVEVNGESAGEFTFMYLDMDYMFRYFRAKGYCQMLHSGQLLLVRKYVKVIKKGAVDGSIDAFEEEVSDYLVRDGRFTRFRTRKDLFNVLADREKEVRRFIREHGISINPRRSESIIPVLEFYETL